MKALALAVAAVALITAPDASAALISTFDNHSEGWKVADLNPDTHQSQVPMTDASIWGPTAGISGGGLRVMDITYWTHVGAPADFLGDWSEGIGSNISFDIFLAYTDGVPYGACAIRGMGHTLFYTAPTPAVGSWYHFVIPIDSGNWRVDGQQGRQATEGDFFEVLRSVEGFYVMTEWNTGSDDTKVDNIAVELEPTRPVGLNIRQKDLLTVAARQGSGHYRFRIWGEVTAVDASGMTLDDGTGNPVRVKTPGPVQQVGDRLAVSGKVSYNGNEVTITSSPEDISWL